MLNKRKIDVENRDFNDKWESTYLFTATSAGKPQCRVCLQVISVMKEYNIKRIYESNHKADYGEYVSEARSAVYADYEKVEIAAVDFCASADDAAVGSSCIVCYLFGVGEKQKTLY